MSRYIAWGIGKKYWNCRMLADAEDLVALIDSSPQMIGRSVDGKEILAPDSLRYLVFDYIVITAAKFSAEIRSQIVFGYGVALERIMDLDCYLRLHDEKSAEDEEKHRLLFLQKMQELCQIYGIKSWLDGGAYGGLLGKFSFFAENPGDGSEYVNPDAMDFFYRSFFRKSDPNTMEYELAFFENAEDIHDRGMNAAVQIARHASDAEQTKKLFHMDGALYPMDINEELPTVFVVTHKPFQEIEETGYHTIHVGANGYEGSGLTDHKGDHIAWLNPKIDECTAIYWIWRNWKCSIVGINHYRRFFESPLNKGAPLQAAEIVLLLHRYDAVVVKPLDLDKTVLEDMRSTICEEAFQVGWTAVQRVFERRTETDQKALKFVFQGYVYYRSNMMLMHKEDFDRYCEWLFPIVFALEKMVDIKQEWDPYSRRVIGFFTERLFTVWLVQQHFRIKTLPFVLTEAVGSYGK